MPASTAFAAAANGAAFGLLPIGWIILNAIFVYDITVKTGKFEVVKETIGGLAGDRRIQVLLIAFAFGAFIEGAAGFGTPVAISAAMLIGLGFKPLQAAGLALIGAGIAQFARQLRWRPERTLAEPLVTILHLAFLYGTAANLTWEPRLDGFMLVKEMSFAS